MESKESSLWQTLEGDRVDSSPKRPGNEDAIGNAKVGVWNGPKDEPRRGLGEDSWVPVSGFTQGQRDGPDNCPTLENTEKENAVLIQLPPLFESKAFLRNLS